MPDLTDPSDPSDYLVLERTKGVENMLTYTIDGIHKEIDGSTMITVPKGQGIEIELGHGACWYGHGFNHRQPLPLNREPVVNETFAVNNIQCPAWISSDGIALFAETTEALSVAINQGGDNRLRIHCASADWSLHVWLAEDAVAAQQQLLTHLEWPNQVPTAELLGKSWFCTWTQYPRTINQERIVNMGKAIVDHGYPCSVLTIDDRWESTFGELQFGPDFPEPKAMVDQLHQLGLKVLLWVTPFVNREAATFQTLSEEKLLVPARDGNGTALFRWWGGTAGLVDLTNPKAWDWYKSRLKTLMNDYGIDGFKIDGGDAKYQPAPDEAAWFDYQGASGYSDKLLALFEEIAPNMCETRTAWVSQKRNIIWRLGGKDSHWGVDNGLKAVLTLSLNLALIGYDIIIPDMIPGRVQTLVSDMALPSDELLVRWTELSTFFPITQYSYFPWNYQSQTAEVALAYAKVHQALQSYLVDQAQNRQKPLMRPLWYDAPAEKALYTVNDQFLLGDDLMVAPVLDENQVARDILLPPGEWCDAWTGSTLEGELLALYPAPCPGVPLFVRAGNQALLGRIQSVLKGVKRGTIASDITSTSYQAGLDRDLSVTG